MAQAWLTSGFEPNQKLELHVNLLFRQFNSSSGLTNKVRDIYCMPTIFLPNGLLIVHKPHVPAILICMEYSFVLHNQYMFFPPREMCGWDALECFIFIRSHQTCLTCNN